MGDTSMVLSFAILHLWHANTTYSRARPRRVSHTPHAALTTKVSLGGDEAVLPIVCQSKEDSGIRQLSVPAPPGKYIMKPTRLPGSGISTAVGSSGTSPDVSQSAT